MICSVLRKPVGSRLATFGHAHQLFERVGLFFLRADQAIDHETIDHWLWLGACAERHERRVRGEQDGEKRQSSDRSRHAFSICGAVAATAMYAPRHVGGTQVDVMSYVAGSRGRAVARARS